MTHLESLVLFPDAHNGRYRYGGGRYSSKNRWFDSETSPNIPKHVPRH